MQQRITRTAITVMATTLLFSATASAFDMGNMMNPSKWMGGNKDDDRYDDYRGPGGYGPPPGAAPGYGYGQPPGYGGAPGYGAAPGYAPAPGYGYEGTPAYGAPGYGGGAPGYGAAPGYGGGAPGYGAAPAYGAPQGDAREAEIKRLKERLRQLESGLQ